MITIEVFSEGIVLPYKGISKKNIADIAHAAAALLMLDNALVTIIVSDNAYIRTINKKYRGYNAPTDVLSFSNRDNPSSAPALRQKSTMPRSLTR
jgi:ssRNA-specific RNase YbeY (16S rRNA maturation enzyme)